MEYKALPGPVAGWSWLLDRDSHKLNQKKSCPPIFVSSCAHQVSWSTCCARACAQQRLVASKSAKSLITVMARLRLPRFNTFIPSIYSLGSLLHTPLPSRAWKWLRTALDMKDSAGPCQTSQSCNREGCNTATQAISWLRPSKKLNYSFKNVFGILNVDCLWIMDNYDVLPFSDLNRLNPFRSHACAAQGAKATATFARHWGVNSSGLNCIELGLRGHHPRDGNDKPWYLGTSKFASDQWLHGPASSARRNLLSLHTWQDGPAAQCQRPTRS